MTEDTPENVVAPSLEPGIEPATISHKDIMAKKTVTCMVDLGVDIVNDMVGSSVSIYGNPAELPTLMAAAINNELTL